MNRPQRKVRSGFFVTISVLVLMMLTVPMAAASASAFTVKPSMALHNSPSPIPHSVVLDPSTIGNHMSQSGGLRPQSSAAGSGATQQDLDGQPGVLPTTTDISSGITLFDVPAACNDFNRRGRWEGELWKNYYAGWGLFAADDGRFQAENVTFDREQVVGPGSNYGRNEASLKIASNHPYEAGVMSPPIQVKPGDLVRVHVSYLVFNHGIPAESLDYASMGIIPDLGERASYTFGYRRGEWATLDQEIQATGDQIVVMLQGHSPATLNSNIYFDNVQIYINNRRVRNCLG